MLSRLVAEGNSLLRPFVPSKIITFRHNFRLIRPAYFFVVGGNNMFTSSSKAVALS